jgi:hypothetical protein
LAAAAARRSKRGYVVLAMLVFLVTRLISLLFLVMPP